MDSTLSDFLFRKQYIISPNPFALTDSWYKSQIKEKLYLCAHPTLDIREYEDEEVELYLMGSAIDSRNPGRSKEEVMSSFDLESIDSIIKSTWPVCGRWALLIKYGKRVYLLTDPCGFRQAYYFVEEGTAWCASQPELIREARGLSLRDSTDFTDFLPLLSGTESAWVGDQTVYENCFHLLPNHYLDFDSCTSVRFFPKKNIRKKRTERVVEEAASLLKGTIEGISRRDETIEMAITAGIDTRILFSASRRFSEKVKYYVDRMGFLPERHADVQIPKKMTEKVGVEFEVRNSTREVPGWFSQVLSRSVTGARYLKKHDKIYPYIENDYNSLNINGNASEICRSYSGLNYPKGASNVNETDLASILGYPSSPFAVSALKKWLESLPTFDRPNVLELLHWEQKLGNWGAQMFSETQIAFDQISPFNNRALLTTLLAAPRDERTGRRPQLYEDLIQRMWPPLLKFPVNRLEVKDRIINRFKTAICNTISLIYPLIK